MGAFRARRSPPVPPKGRSCSDRAAAASPHGPHAWLRSPFPPLRQPYGGGTFRHAVGRNLWGARASDVLEGGVASDELTLMIVVKIKKARAARPQKTVAA